MIEYALNSLYVVIQPKNPLFSDGEILYGRRDIDDPMRNYNQPLIQAESVRT